MAKQKTLRRYQEQRRHWLDRVQDHPLVGPEVVETARRLSTGSTASVDADHYALLVGLGFLRKLPTGDVEIWLP